VLAHAEEMDEVLGEDLRNHLKDQCGKGLRRFWENLTGSPDIIFKRPRIPHPEGIESR
jgi:hypothetical protein